MDEIDGQDEPVVMVHDYHLYTLPGMVREERPDVFLHHFIHIPWTQPDAWRVLPKYMRDEIYKGLLANDIIGFHTRSYQRNFLQCCRDLMDLEVSFDDGIVVCEGREVWVRAYPLPIDYEATRSVARRPRVREFEERVLARRREYAILRVDRADLSKNVLRGFSAFDIFLEQHPEFSERITFTAQLMPSRTDVPEYAEYLEKIEALVAVVNHRHGTPDWMPIDLKLRDDLDEAVASYKHYDVMMVNAMFDGMNLVAKEGPLVNERHGVSILSENTGAHEELGEFALSVNPFDVQELADAIYSALMMSSEARERRARGLKEIVTSRDPGDWIDEQIADIRAKGATKPARPRLRCPRNRTPSVPATRRSAAPARVAAGRTGRDRAARRRPIGAAVAPRRAPPLPSPRGSAPPRSSPPRGSALPRFVAATRLLLAAPVALPTPIASTASLLAAPVVSPAPAALFPPDRSRRRVACPRRHARRAAHRARAILAGAPSSPPLASSPRVRRHRLRRRPASSSPASPSRCSTPTVLGRRAARLGERRPAGSRGGGVAVGQAMAVASTASVPRVSATLAHRTRRSTIAAAYSS